MTHPKRAVILSTMLDVQEKVAGLRQEGWPKAAIAGEFGAQEQTRCLPSDGTKGTDQHGGAYAREDRLENGRCHSVEILGVLEGLGLGALDHSEAQHVAYLASTFQLCNQDRRAFLGDPEHVGPEPFLAMTSSERVDRVREAVVAGVVCGKPPRPKSPHTTHVTSGRRRRQHRRDHPQPRGPLGRDHARSRLRLQQWHEPLRFQARPPKLDGPGQDSCPLDGADDRFQAGPPLHRPWRAGR